MGRTHISQWFSKFRSSVTWAEDASVVRKTDKNVETVKELVLKNCEVSNTLRISFGSIESILKVSMYIRLPCMLHNELKENHVSTCQILASHERHSEFLLKINSGDKNPNSFKQKAIQLHHHD